MTPEQITLVKNSFSKVVPIREQAASLFYGRLFELDPSLKPLFKGDMKEQGVKLMAMIATAVAGLRALDGIVPAVQALAKRHVDYGVQPSHYATVGAALLWTLQQGLGADFTPEVKEAWTACYGLLSGTMQQAAYA